MPRPRKYRDDAEKQRVYRLRRKIESTDEEQLHYARLERLHAVVRRAADSGDEGAKKLLGRNASDTALKLILASQPDPPIDDVAPLEMDFVGFNIGYYAYEEAASCVLLDKAEMTSGVFKVVLGTEKRAPRKAKTIAERPKRQGKSREIPKSHNSRPAPKSR
jgi:hypothetical protein